MIAEFEKEEKELTEKGEKLDFRKIFALVLLHRQKGNMVKAVEYLDALTMTASGDIRYREQVVLKLFTGMPEDPTMKKRGELAVQRLLNYQLNGAELKDLRQALRVLDRKEEADKIRDRMLATVTDMETQYELLNELRNDPNKERTVQFALKVFRSPAIRGAINSGPNDFSRHVRDRALDILQANGKLTEIVEQIEAQWRSSPGSIDIMTALADIYNKAGRKDDAKKIAKEIGEKMTDDAVKIQAYANLLQNLGMNTEAAEWTLKSFEKNPERILQNFYQYEQNFRNSNQIPQLIAILKKIPPQRIAEQFGSGLSSRVTDWQRNPATKDAAQELLDYIWAMEGASDNERRQGRAEFVRSLVHNPNEAYYPMFYEVIFDAVAAREAEAGNNPQQIVYRSYMNPFGVYSWSTDKCYCVAVSFFDIAARKNALEETKKEFQKAVEEHEAIDEKKRDKNQYRNARLGLAMNEIRLKNAEPAVKLIEAVWKEANAPEMRNEHSGLILALELSTLDEPAAVELAIKMFEEQVKGNRNDGMSMYVENICIAPLTKLYLKTDRAEEGRTLAANKLRESFRYLKLCDANGSYQTANRYYNSYELQQSALTMSRALLDAGHAFELMTIYREMYDGQSWVKIQKERSSYRFQELDSIAKELEGKITAKDFTENLELLIPGMSPTKAGMERSAMTEKIDPKTALPLMLGSYLLTAGMPGNDAAGTSGGSAASVMLDWIKRIGEVAKPDDASAIHLAGIRLADSLAIVAKDDPPRYAAVKKAIEALEKAAPDEPSVLIALTSCRLIDGDHAAVESLLRRCVEWTKSEKAAGEINQQIHLGFWSILKKMFADETLLAKPEVRTDAETLFLFAGRLTSQITAGTPDDRRAQVLGQATPIQSFLLDVKRHAPDALYQKFRPDFDAKVFERILMPVPGHLTRSLETQRHRVAEELSEGISLAPGAVMQVFRTAFANGYPALEGGGGLSRENSMHLLFVFGEVLAAAKNAEVEPGIVYEALRDIVLPESETRKPFLAEFDDLGGPNGYFRTPAADLVDWAVAADKVDDLKQRIALKRSHPESARLDVVDLLLALKTKDDKRSTELIAKFLQGVREDNPQVSMFGVMAAVPAAKPFERSELTEHYPVLRELIDALIVSDSEDVKNARGRRYAYYMVRSFYGAFEKEATIPQKIRWIQHYRGVAPLDQMDGFLFATEDRIYHEGLAAIDGDKLGDAVAVLRYFASHRVDHFRYRALTELMEKLEPKLAALDATKKTELLGDFDLTTVVKRGTVNREKGLAERLPAKQFDLPPLPEGTVVYQNDFEKQVGTEWSMDRRDTMPKIDNTYLGEFQADRVRFQLADLPEHQFVRIRFDLLMLAGLDGLVGYPREFGVDVWGMEIAGKEGAISRPIVSTFSNFHNDPNAQTQSFPDDYPPEFGVKPAWFDQLLSDRLWMYDDSANFGKGVYHGRHGAVWENKFGYEKDSVYTIDMVVPHTGAELSLEFFTKFRDGPYGNGYINLALGESWGLDNFQVETLTKPLELDADALKKCFDALIGNDAAKSEAARWRLVAAGNVSVEYIAGWFKDEANAAKCKEIQKPDNFDRFRIDRVLQLIATPEAETLRGEMK